MFLFIPSLSSSVILNNSDSVQCSLIDSIDFFLIASVVAIESLEIICRQYESW